MADLFNYLDYRHYLKDYYREQKEKKGSQFSFRTFARSAGMSSPNFLKLVTEGKRNLGPDGIERFAKALKLNKEEFVYFTNLVHFNQSSTDDERNGWYRRLSMSRKYREVRQIENDYFVYYSHWYYSAVRELVLLPDFKESPEWIAKKLSPAITAREAKTALELLLKMGFVKREASGKLVQSERNITTAREVQSLAISNYHRQMMQLASESIERVTASKRDISSLTLCLSRDKFKEAKRRLQEFRRELNVLLSEDARSEAVYQINLQIFNLSEVPWVEN